MRKAVSIRGLIQLLSEPDNLTTLNRQQTRPQLYPKNSVNFRSLLSVDSHPGSRHELQLEETDIKKEGLSKIKPNLLSLLNILFLKMGDKSNDQIHEYRKLMAEFIQKEITRIMEIPHEYKLTEEFANYLFERLLIFFHEYISKIFFVSREGEEESLDGKALAEYSQALYQKLGWIAANCTSSQIQICKDFLGYYYEEVELNKEIATVKPIKTQKTREVTIMIDNGI